jgi:hypothetical protein
MLMQEGTIFETFKVSKSSLETSSVNVVIALPLFLTSVINRTILLQTLTYGHEIENNKLTKWATLTVFY